MSKNDLTVSDSNAFVDISWNIALSFPSLPVIESSDFSISSEAEPLEPPMVLMTSLASSKLDNTAAITLMPFLPPICSSSAA